MDEKSACVTSLHVILSFRLSMDDVTSPTASTLDLWGQRWLWRLALQQY